MFTEKIIPNVAPHIRVLGCRIFSAGIHGKNFPRYDAIFVCHLTGKIFVVAIGNCTHFFGVV